MTYPADTEVKLAIAAASGVGKTALIRCLQNDQRLAGRLIADVDWYRRSKDGSSSETKALRALLKKKVDALFGVMIDERTRSRLQSRGWSFVVLSLPEAEHRRRMAQGAGTGRRSGMTVDESIAVQRRLEGLGYSSIDAGRPIDVVAAEVARAVRRTDRRERLAILGSWSVGKTTLARYLRSDAASSRRSWRSRLLVDCAEFLDADALREEVDAAADPGPRLERWNRAERRAVRAARARGIDVVGGTFTTAGRQAMLAAKGFSFVVLSLPEPIHRARLAKRLRESSWKIDVEAAVDRQRRLEGRGFETIDASRTLPETADAVLARLGLPLERESD
jgi:hypothetical protein